LSPRTTSARSIVCSTVSVVSTPKTTGTPADDQIRRGRSDHQTIWYCPTPATSARNPP
jgi:hypothetical protein